MKLPLRVDFAGGWLDVPRFAIPGAYIVNCAISPLVELRPPTWTMGIRFVGSDEVLPKGAGVGGSAAMSMLRGLDVRTEEAAQGCGWQDEAVISETGLCCWASGPEPVLVHRDSGDWLAGRMALYWTGKSHDSASIVERERDYRAIERAASVATRAVQYQSIEMLAVAIDRSYDQQRFEGMERLPSHFGMAYKYCGAGHGGYAVYLFETREDRDSACAERGLSPVEPYCKPESINESL